MASVSPETVPRPAPIPPAFPCLRIAPEALSPLLRHRRFRLCLARARSLFLSSFPASLSRMRDADLLFRSCRCLSERPCDDRSFFSPHARDGCPPPPRWRRGRDSYRPDPACPEDPQGMLALRRYRRDHATGPLRPGHHGARALEPDCRAEISLHGLSEDGNPYGD